MPFYYGYERNDAIAAGKSQARLADKTGKRPRTIAS
jgi:hypothetical protein